MRASAFIRKTATRGSNAKARVYFRVRDAGCDIKAASELDINPGYWDSKRQGYKPRVSLISETARNTFDRSVQEILSLISKEYFIGADSHWLKQLLFSYHHPNAYRMKGRECVNMSLAHWLERYRTERLTERKQQGIYKLIIGLVGRFEVYQRQICKRKNYVMNIGTMTAEDLRGLEKYIANEYQYVKLYPKLYDINDKSISKERRGGNYLSGLMGRISTAFNWAIKQGATTNRPFDGYEIPAKVYGTPYYLTLEERNAVYDMDLSDDPALASHRDVFMFQCLVGCRYSDLVRLTSDNIVNGAVEYIPHKTREKNPRTVRVPLNEKAQAILERLQGRQRTTKTLIPHNAIGKYNTAIRKLLTLAGITRNVPVLNPKTHEEIMKPINEIASSHMARRVFIGNLYKQVKDPNLVASMSGHVEGSHAFARYRTIDDEMKIELVNLIN